MKVMLASGPNRRHPLDANSNFNLPSNCYIFQCIIIFQIMCPKFQFTVRDFNVLTVCDISIYRFQFTARHDHGFNLPFHSLLRISIYHTPFTVFNLPRSRVWIYRITGHGNWNPTPTISRVMKFQFTALLSFNLLNH